MGYGSDVLCLAGGRFTPEKRSHVGAFLFFQAVVYMTIGCSMEFIPDLWPAIPVPLVKPFQSEHEQGWFRALGWYVFYIGVIYAVQALRENHHFALVCVFTRLTFVNLVLALPLGYMGYAPIGLLIMFVLWDSSAAIMTYAVCSRTATSNDWRYWEDLVCSAGSRFPSRWSTLGAFMVFQGLAYNIVGLSMEFFPHLWQATSIVETFDSKQEEGWFRGFGFTVFYVGLFYISAGINDNEHFAMASVFTRLVCVSVILIAPLTLMRLLPGSFCVAFEVFESSLALMTYAVWRQRTKVTTDPGYAALT